MPIQEEDIPRVSPEETRAKLQTDGALLVCAYDDPEKCKGENNLAGSIDASSLHDKLSDLEKGKEIILYCA